LLHACTLSLHRDLPMTRDVDLSLYASSGLAHTSLRRSRRARAYVVMHVCRVGCPAEPWSVVHGAEPSQHALPVRLTQVGVLAHLLINRRRLLDRRKPYSRLGTSCAQLAEPSALVRPFRGVLPPVPFRGVLPPVPLRGVLPPSSFVPWPAPDLPGPPMLGRVRLEGELPLA